MPDSPATDCGSARLVFWFHMNYVACIHCRYVATVCFRACTFCKMFLFLSVQSQAKKRAAMREANDSKTTTLSAAGAGMADNYGGSSRSPLPSASSPSPVDNGKRSSSVTTLPSLEESTPTKDTHSGECEMSYGDGQRS